MLEEKLARLEKKLIPTSDWESAPNHVREMAQKNSDEGAPTGIAFDSEYGWCVLESCGQGPILIYAEKKPTTD
jgi:hypothetical protein